MSARLRQTSRIAVATGWCLLLLLVLAPAGSAQTQVPPVPADKPPPFNNSQELPPPFPANPPPPKSPKVILSVTPASESVAPSQAGNVTLYGLAIPLSRMIPCAPGDVLTIEMVYDNSGSNNYADAPSQPSGPFSYRIRAVEPAWKFSAAQARNEPVVAVLVERPVFSTDESPFAMQSIWINSAQTLINSQLQMRVLRPRQIEPAVLVQMCQQLNLPSQNTWVKVTVDPGTSALLVRGLPSDVELVENFVKWLDQPSVPAETTLADPFAEKLSNLKKAAKLPPDEPKSLPANEIDLQCEVLPIRFRAAADVYQTISDFSAERGYHLAIHGSWNALILRGTADSLEQIKLLVESLDKPTPPVELAAQRVATLVKEQPQALIQWTPPAAAVQGKWKSETFQPTHVSADSLLSLVQTPQLLHNDIQAGRVLVQALPQLSRPDSLKKFVIRGDQARVDASLKLLKDLDRLAFADPEIENIREVTTPDGGTILTQASPDQGIALIEIKQQNAVQTLGFSVELRLVPSIAEVGSDDDGADTLVDAPLRPELSNSEQLPPSIAAHSELNFESVPTPSGSIGFLPEVASEPTPTPTPNPFELSEAQARFEKLDREATQLAQQLTHAPLPAESRQASEQKLVETLQAAFDAQQQAQSLELAQLQQRLQNVQARLAARVQKKDEIIQRRRRLLLGEDFDDWGAPAKSSNVGEPDVSSVGTSVPEPGLNSFPLPEVSPSSEGDLFIEPATPKRVGAPLNGAEALAPAPVSASGVPVEPTAKMAEPQPPQEPVSAAKVPAESPNLPAGNGLFNETSLIPSLLETQQQLETAFEKWKRMRGLDDSAAGPQKAALHIEWKALQHRAENYVEILNDLVALREQEYDAAGVELAAANIALDNTQRLFEKAVVSQQELGLARLRSQLDQSKQTKAKLALESTRKLLDRLKKQLELIQQESGEPAKSSEPSAATSGDISSPIPAPRRDSNELEPFNNPVPPAEPPAASAPQPEPKPESNNLM